MDFAESLAEVMFRYTKYVMYLAPFGVGAAMAVTVGTKGIGVLFGLGKLIATMYVALAIFVVVVLGAVIVLLADPAPAFLRSCARAVPDRLLHRFERGRAAARAREHGALRRPEAHCRIRDADGLQLQSRRDDAVSCRWLRCLSRRPPASRCRLASRLIMMLTLMLTSKGVAGVPRAALVILAGTLATFNLADGRRSCAAGHRRRDGYGSDFRNVLGNCLATAVVARWEGIEVGAVVPTANLVVPTTER